MNTPEDNLEITARKLKVLFRDEVQQAADDGTTGPNMFAVAECLRRFLLGHVQRNEGVNSAIKRWVEKCPNISLPLLSGRISVSVALGMMGRKGERKWSQVRQQAAELLGTSNDHFQGARLLMDDELRWSTTPPARELPGMESIKRCMEEAPHENVRSSCRGPSLPASRSTPQPKVQNSFGEPAGRFRFPNGLGLLRSVLVAWSPMVARSDCFCLSNDNDAWFGGVSGFVRFAQVLPRDPAFTDAGFRAAAVLSRGLHRHMRTPTVRSCFALQLLPKEVADLGSPAALIEGMPLYFVVEKNYSLSALVQAEARLIPDGQTQERRAVLDLPFNHHLSVDLLQTWYHDVHDHLPEGSAALETHVPTGAPLFTFCSVVRLAALQSCSVACNSSSASSSTARAQGGASEQQ